MRETYAELGFDAVLTVATGIALAAYMLGVVLDPVPASVVGFVLVATGVIALVPREGRAPAAAIGLLSVGIAGIAVPRAITTFVAVPAGSELPTALAGSGLVLLLAFALVRTTAFRNPGGRAV